MCSVLVPNWQHYREVMRTLGVGPTYIEGMSLKGVLEPCPLFSSLFASTMNFHHDLSPPYRSKTNQAKWLWSETSKPVSQNKHFPPLSWLLSSIFSQQQKANLVCFFYFLPLVLYLVKKWFQTFFPFFQSAQYFWLINLFHCLSQDHMTPFRSFLLLPKYLATSTLSLVSFLWTLLISVTFHFSKDSLNSLVLKPML